MNNYLDFQNESIKIFRNLFRPRLLELTLNDSPQLKTETITYHGVFLFGTKMQNT